MIIIVNFKENQLHSLLETSGRRLRSGGQTVSEGKEIGGCCFLVCNRSVGMLTVASRMPFEEMLCKNV